MQVVAHNLASQFISRQLNMTTEEKRKTSEKLSSGYRINRSADDASGLAISEKLRWQIRGLDKASTNISDGISIGQVAEGALNEVHDMLHRMNELAVQAANDTNTKSDREAIQNEIDALVDEIDRIGEDTVYNTMKLFKGGYTDVLDQNGNPIRLSDIPITDFRLPQITNANLTDGPVYEGSRNYLNLGVELTEDYSDARFDLIYGHGRTSHSSVKVEYEDDNGNTVTVIKDLDDLEIISESNNNSAYWRTYKLIDGNGLDVNIVQRISIEPHTGTSQDYSFQYVYTNNSNMDIDISFMFNADSAYNNNDHVEGYYIGGQSVDNFCVYTRNADYLAQNSPYIYGMDAFQGGKSFSIVDVDDALPFSVKLAWPNAAANELETVSIGNWRYDTYDWGYYDNLPGKLGGNTDGRDLAFSLIFKGAMNGSNANMSGEAGLAHFTYGFTQTSTDSNLAGVPITYHNTPKVHVDVLDLWIQAGAVEGSGIFISIGEMDSGILGVRGLDVTSYARAQRAIERVGEAIEKISEQRSMIGAQQNRLDHARAIDDNIGENSQAAESRIRDTDIMTEMVNQAKHKILEQAGQSMLVQANQTPNGILQLLNL